jgi:hypothetical protein
MSVPAPAVPVSAERVRNPYAVASIVLAAIVTVITITDRVLSLAAPSIQASAHLSVAGLSALFAVVGAAGVAVALAAAVLGAIGVTRPGLPHALAAAGLGIGITAAGSYLLTYLATAAVAGSGVLG